MSKHKNYEHMLRVTILRLENVGKSYIFEDIFSPLRGLIMDFFIREKNGKNKD